MDALKTYRRKRDLSTSPEPKGGKIRKQDKQKRLFVVQKHDARRLHYDFRLEIGGVLVSWAVPKGPSYKPADKRLAVRVEDHPLSYGDFEGLIPENHYGAGPVMLWDRGYWEPLDKDPRKALRSGKLSFKLHGTKLRGGWTLTRMDKKETLGRENWLLIKNSDDEANESADENFLDQTNYSVKSGLGLEEIAAGKTGGVRADRFNMLEKQYNQVQLAALTDTPPQGDQWLHEVKYDGYRILVFVRDGAVRVRTRNGHNWTNKFPQIVEALKAVKSQSFVIDGEAVVIDENGISSFKRLQNALGDKKAPMQAYFFDLLYHNGHDYSAEPFKERRKALEKLFQHITENPLYLSETLEGDARKVVAQACELGLEGIISKRKDAIYSPGRSKSWLKSKCDKRQEFIICGFVPASTLPQAIGALHLGYHDAHGNLAYAGKVGTGFDRKTAKALYTKLSALKRKTPPFSRKTDCNDKGAIWVTPKLLCEVSFGSWTTTGKVRHASYQGLREDKSPEEISREYTVSPLDQKKLQGVSISNPDRVIFPETRITKGALADYYSEMAELIIPMIKNRPISIVRCPDGIDKGCFFQRSRAKGMPEHIYSIIIRHDNNSHDYIYISSAAGLVELAQMGTIEVHPWTVRNDDTEKPDRIIFDLDPDEGVPFEAVKLAAQHVRQNLDALGIRSFLKTTGGKGLHITVPIIRRHDWSTVKEFADNIATRIAKDVPQAYTTNMSKKKRTGKIFIDIHRNDFGATAVMDYCVRARPGAPVAVPLAWEELEELYSPDQFHIADALARRKAGAALLAQFTKTRQSLTEKRLKLAKG